MHRSLEGTVRFDTKHSSKTIDKLSHNSGGGLPFLPAVLMERRVELSGFSFLQYWKSKPTQHSILSLSLSFGSTNTAQSFSYWSS
ncbi:Hypothetical predicted protein [Prunus dulcis]|uniref:Uncharacterized protein n=1 Tax=Prunus dulcis TaxID=3755 RepID=A0A5E4EHM9_PRUDU|nr:Hypothetical predicted protein [Prunus dulcis]